jgi:heterodisulfide reductase subunit A-like polyferredoxin
MFDRVERCSLRVESERESRKKRHEILTRAKVQDSGSSGGFVVEAEKYQTTSRHDAVLCRMRSAVYPLRDDSIYWVDVIRSNSMCSSGPSRANLGWG